MRGLSREGGDVWPRKKFFRFRVNFSNPQKIESILKNNFHGGFPVVMSSGRAGIATLIRLFYKCDSIRIFPYASQCVVESLINSNCAPLTPIDKSNLDISYNQWGRYNSFLRNSPFLEDSVDSFYPIGSKILRSGARFELWSISKIFGLSYGAIIWCKHQTDAEEIRKERDSKNYLLKLIRILLRGTSSLSKRVYTKWQHIEYLNLGLTSLEYGQIYSCVLNWENSYKCKYNLFIKSVSNLNLSQISLELENNNIIPVVIEIPTNLKNRLQKSSKDLHRIVTKKQPISVRIIPYQVEN